MMNSPTSHMICVSSATSKNNNDLLVEVRGTGDGFVNFLAAFGSDASSLKMEPGLPKSSTM